MLRCKDCEWTGKWDECSIGLTENGELIELCPECKSAKLIELDDRLVPVV